MLHGNLGNIRATQINLTVTLWLRNYFNIHCEHLPGDPTIHVPAVVCHKDLYHKMCFEIPNIVISHTQFRHYLCTYFSKVVFSKPTFLGKCGTCLKLVERWQAAFQANASSEQISRLTLECEEHLLFVRQEREAYYARKIDA